MEFIYLYFFTLIISLSFLGYGSLLLNVIDQKLLKENIGYLGISGLFVCSVISYLSIFFTKHDYFHNLVLHFVGISFFIYFIKNKKINFEKKKYFLIFSILFIGLLILRNHDDFNYYHLTYSLGLTENKLILGLGNLGHGYTHHSSIFFLNSIIFLPIIEYFLFHSIGWLTLFFVNLIFIEKLLIKNKKILDFEFYFYLLSFLFINFKFSRLGSFGTDLSGQIIFLTIFPLIFKLYSFKKIENIDKSTLSLIVIVITYLTTLKSFMILNFLYLLPLIFFTKFKNLKYILIPKTVALGFIGLLSLITINLSYTGCAVYPVKQTCLENKLEWSLSKKHVGEMKNWYEQWSKAGAGIEYRVEDPNKYIQKFNWVPNWYERYFVYKFKETILGILFLIVLVMVLFIIKTKKKFIKVDNYTKRSIKILSAVTCLLLFEWFFNHPALRYGGYYLLASIIFILISFFLSKRKIFFDHKRSTIIFLIVLSFSLYNLKNFKRINEELKIVKNHNFPFFYSPKQSFEPTDIGNQIKIYVPTNLQGCWAIKTPCIHHSDHVIGKMLGSYKVILKK